MSSLSSPSALFLRRSPLSPFLSFHVYRILFPLADLFPILRAFLLPRDVSFSRATDAPRFFLSAVAETLRRRLRTKTPVLPSRLCSFSHFPPLGSPFRRPSLNLPGANLYLLSLSHFLPRPSSGCPEYLPSADLYKVFTIFRALPLEIRLLSSPLSLFLASCLSPSLATRGGARDPGDNPVYLSDKRPINLFALSPTPLPPNPRPRAH